MVKVSERLRLAPDPAPRNFPDRLWKKARRVARDVARRRLAAPILRTRPSPRPDPLLPYTIHTLIRQRDLIMGIWSAKSLNLAAGQPLRWVFHDDGTLTAADRDLLAAHLPGSPVVTLAESTARVERELAQWPRILRHRARKVHLMKAFDVPLYATERFVFCDTDILFFDRPAEFLDAAGRDDGPNVFNRDRESAYAFDPEVLAAIIRRPVLPRINCGLFATDRSSLNPELVDEWLGALPLDRPYNLHRLEQTVQAMAACASEKGATYLPPSYDVSYEKDVRAAPCKHYVGWIRHGFELEGVRYLVEERDFLTRWEAWARA